MYDIAYSTEALVDLETFKKHEQNVIVDAIEKQLRYEPTSETRNRKQLRANPIATWELRIDNFRVFYDVDELVKIVDIQRIGEKRGNQVFLRGRKEQL